MTHGLMYHGGFERNFGDLASGARTFRGSDGSERTLAEWPEAVNGVRVGYMEKPGKRFVAVRVQDDDSDVVLRREVVLDPPRHMGYGKRFSAEPTIVDNDGVIRQLLDDMITQNPDQKAELTAIRDRIPQPRRSGDRSGR